MTIKELRTSAGMTQKAFEDYFKIPHRTLQDWERGINVSAPYLVELIEYKLRKEGLIK